jgi:hypothetical protein
MASDDDEILCYRHDCDEPAWTRLARSGLPVCFKHCPSGGVRITTLYRWGGRRSKKGGKTEQQLALPEGGAE